MNLGIDEWERIYLYYGQIECLSAKDFRTIIKFEYAAETRERWASELAYTVYAWAREHSVGVAFE